MRHFISSFIGEQERRLLRMAPGPEVARPISETTEAPKEVRQLRISPDSPVDMQTQVLDASTQRSTQAMNVEFNRRDQVAASLQRQYDGMKGSGMLDSYEGRTREWIDATNASLGGRYTVGIRNGEVRLYPTGNAPVETRSNGLPPKPPMAPNRPSPATPNAPEGAAPAAPNTPKNTPPAAPEKGAPAPKAAADAPSDPVKGEGAPEGEKPAAGLDGEIPKKDQENLKKLAEKMLDGQDPTKMSEKQKDMLVGRVQMNTGVGVVEKGNKFEAVAPKTNMERLMNALSGVMLFVQALFAKEKSGDKKTDGSTEKKDGLPEPSTTPEQRKKKIEEQQKKGKTLYVLSQELSDRVSALEQQDVKDENNAQMLADLRAEAEDLRSMTESSSEFMTTAQIDAVRARSGKIEATMTSAPAPEDDDLRQADLEPVVTEEKTS